MANLEKDFEQLEEIKIKSDLIRQAGKGIILENVIANMLNVGTISSKQFKAELARVLGTDYEHGVLNRESEFLGLSDSYRKMYITNALGDLFILAEKGRPYNG
jgi:hypothetical protein